MADWAQIEADIAALLEREGFELVQLVTTLGKGARVVILADRSGAAGTINLDDCAAISRQVSPYLDRVDPFAGPYRLEVSSPGVDRPLNRLAHCRQFIGRRVRVKHHRDGRPETVEGRLTAVEDETLVLDREGERWEVRWPDVVKANVVYEWDED